MGMQKIIPHIWFDRQAEEAVRFYTSVFRGGTMGTASRYTEAGKEVHGMEPGTVMTVEFEVEGTQFLALNGGPHFRINPSISFIVSRESEEEINALWEILSEDGAPIIPLDAYPFSKRYGWVQDRFGVAWQLILPNAEGDWRPPLVPSLLFTGGVCGRAEEAVGFYRSVFGQPEEGRMVRYGTGQEPNLKDDVMYGDFTLFGQWFAVMDARFLHGFAFNEAISLMVTCRDQEEIDRYWEMLSAAPEAEQCGWLKDRFGVSWQIVPEGMGEILNDPDPEKAKRAMEAMLSMKKIDVAKLRSA